MPILYQAEPVFEGAERVAIRQYAQSIRANERMRAAGGESVALALEHIGGSVNAMMNALGETVNGIFDEITVTDAETGAVIGWIGTDAATGAQGIWAKEAYFGGSDPTTAPFAASSTGRVTLTLGDSDDQAYLSVLDSGGSPVVWMGKTGSDYGLWADNIWIGGTGPADAPLFSDGTAVVIGDNGYLLVKDHDGNEIGWFGARQIASVWYDGGWVREWRIGGDDTANAIIVADTNGDVSIAGGDIYLGPGATGDGGRLFSYTGSTLTGWVGAGDVAAPVAITNIVAGVVTTGAAHGLIVGDWTFIDGTSNAAHRGIWEVATVPGAASFTATGLSGSSTGGTSTKQQTGAWFREFRAGGTSPSTANIVADSSGNVSITDATFSLTISGVTTEIKNQTVTGFGTELAGIYVTRASNNTQSLLFSTGLYTGINGTPYGKFTADTGGAGGVLNLNDTGGVTKISGVGATGLLSATTFGAGDNLYNASGFHAKVGLNTYARLYGDTGGPSSGGVLILYSTGGAATIQGSGETGALYCTYLDVTDAATTRTNLDVYSKAEVDALIPNMANYYTKTEVDALLAGKSSSTHTHAISVASQNVPAVPNTHSHGASSGTPIG